MHRQLHGEKLSAGVDIKVETKFECQHVTDFFVNCTGNNVLTVIIAKR